MLSIWASLKTLSYGRVKTISKIFFDYQYLFIIKNTNFVRKGEYAGYKHFHLFSHLFPLEALFQKVIKSYDCTVKSRRLI